MSILLVRTTATAIAVVVCVGASYAQERRATQTDRRSDQTETQRSFSDQNESRRGNQADSQRLQGRRTGADNYGQGITVQQALVRKIQKSNEAEIELAKMAQQKTDNQELKQLTQTIIQDHQALNQQLQQVAGQDRQVAGRGQSGQGQLTQRQNDRALNDRDPARSADRLANRDPSNEPPGAPGGRATRSMNRQSQTVPPQLCQIMEEACDNAMQMTKEMLNQYEGQDFQMAYLGQQIVMHTIMLAELQAIQSNGPEQLQTIAKQASEKVQNHLEKAKQLAKKLEDDAKNQNRAG